MSERTRLHIIVPGLAGPLAEVPPLKQNPQLARWIKTLSRAGTKISVKTRDDSLYRVLNDVFSLGLPASDIDAVFPSAAFTLAADSMLQPGHYYLHADPVYLRADIDHAVLSSSAYFELDEEEAESFCDSLNRHFEQDGLRFFYTDSKHWFVESRDAISLQTTPLRYAVARNINLLLPRGEDATRWKQVLNESQMLLFATDANARREQRGQLPVNSLWLHGAGELPAAVDMKIASVCSNMRLLQGIAQSTGADFHALPEDASQYLEHLSAQPGGGEHVIHLVDLEHCANYTDTGIWLQALDDLLDRWLYPLLDRSAGNRVALMLYPCHGRRYGFDGREKYRFWRRGRVEQHIGAFGEVNSE